MAQQPGLKLQNINIRHFTFINSAFRIPISDFLKTSIPPHTGHGNPPDLDYPWK